MNRTLWPNHSWNSFPKSLADRQLAEKIMENLGGKYRVRLQTRKGVLPAKDSAASDWITTYSQHAHRHAASKAEPHAWQNPLIYGYNLLVMAAFLAGDEEAPSLRGKTDLINIAPPFDSKADCRTPITLAALTDINNLPWIVI